MTSIKEALQQGRKTLASSSGTASLDAQVLLADLLERPRSWVLAHSDEALQPDQIASFEERLQLCASGQPLPYIVGWWEFYGRKFEVSPAVLIPRPETELLVEQALAYIRQYQRIVHVSDVGTGSGCIAVTLALEATNVSVAAIDRSRSALKIARSNCRSHGVEERVKLIQGDLLSPINQSFDLICANLPYIPTQDLVQLAVSKTEPRLALDGGSNGLEQITRLLTHLERRLAPEGLAILEIGAGQGNALKSTLPDLSGMAIEIKADFSGKDRMMTVRKRA